MAIVMVHEYIQKKINNGMKNKELAKQLYLTQAMVGQYRLKRGYKASLTVAKRVYVMDKIVLHPYSEESLKYEIGEYNES